MTDFTVYKLEICFKKKKKGKDGTMILKQETGKTLQQMMKGECFLCHKGLLSPNQLKKPTKIPRGVERT